MAYCEHDVAFARKAWKLKEGTWNAIYSGSQVGAIIVNPELEIVGKGLSKLPPGVHYIVEGNYWRYVVHAEQNAIGYGNDRRLRGCTLYTTRLPCRDCAALIKAKKIRRVVYIEDVHDDSGLDILYAANIPCVQVPEALVGL